MYNKKFLPILTCCKLPSKGISQLSVSEQWIIDPFLFNADQIAGDDVLREDRIDLKENQAMILLLDAAELASFLCSSI